MSTEATPKFTLRDDASALRELREARLEIQALRTELARVAPHIDDLKKQVVVARQQGERYRFQVETLRRSSSWRITKPLRLFRRRRPDSLR